MEIDLKKTPLSEIDLSKIDYKKSYVIYENCKYLIIENSIKYYEDGLYKMDSNPRRGFLFYQNGNHYYKEATLHLFYKEDRDCETCHYSEKWRYSYPCSECSTVTGAFNEWIPIQPTKKQTNHDIVIEYQDLGDTVKIVKIEGVMSADEILRHAGMSVRSRYFINSSPYMYAEKDRLVIHHAGKDEDFFSVSLHIGLYYDKDKFMKYVEIMKLSAKRLAKLIKDSKEPEIKRIVI